MDATSALACLGTLSRVVNWRRVPWRLRYEYGAQAASEARRLMIEATHRHATVRFDTPVRLGPGFELIMPSNGTFIVGRGVDFRRHFKCEISGNGRVVIGPGCSFSGYALVGSTTSVEIGSRCAFGQNLIMMDGKHRWGDWTKHLLDQGYDYKPIAIGNNVSVWGNVTILANIGDGAIVANNSVVNHDVPPYCFVGGAPARIIRYFGPPEMRPAELDERAV